MDNNIDINVIVNGKEELQNLSVSLRRMILAIQDSANATKVLDARQRALNAALGNTGRGLSDHAKNLRQVASNQAVLGAEIKKTTQELKNLNRIAASGRGGAGMGGLIKDLDLTSKNLKKVKARALATDLRNVGQEMKRLGKDAQFVGRSLIIGLTTPIVAFGRVGLQNFYAIDKQLVRLEKLLGRTRDQFQGITNAVTDFSYEFGIAKELLIGVAGDFAELGINADEVITGLTDLAAQFTILGDMDVNSARELTQTLYLGSLRSMEMTGEIRKFTSAAEAQAFAMKNVNAQMYLFNALENATALSMREIAEALPEVSAAGQIFGLNFTEMMALLAPMKAIGIDTGAAATGIKVSFQKLVNPTIKLQKELRQLSAEAKRVGDTDLAEDFLNIQGIGMDAIQSLVDVTASLKESAGGSEAVLSFYSKLFDDRQATRMLIAMEDLANFQAGFFASATGGAVTAQERFVEAINKSLQGTGLLVHDVQSLSEVTMLANARLEEGAQSMYIEALGREVTAAEINAAKNARRDLQEFIKTESEAGRNAIEDITSEAGKALAINFAGAASAMELAEKELQKAKDSTAMSIDRIRIAFKNLTATFIEDLAPTIRDISDRFQNFVKRIQEMDPETRKLIAAVVGVAAAIGPLVFVFGQARLAGGVLLESIMRLVPGLKTLSVTSVASSSKLLNLKNGLSMTGDTIVNTNSRFSTFIATLASGNGPVARLANSFGQFTGILSKTKTASADVTAAVTNLSKAGSQSLSQITAIGNATTGMSPFTGKMAMGKEVQRMAQGTAAAGMPAIARQQFGRQAGINIARAQAAGVTPTTLARVEARIASQVTGASLKAAERGIAQGSAQFAEFTERSFRNAVQGRLQAGIAQGVDYTSRGQAKFRGQTLSMAQESRIVRGGVGGALTKAGITVPQVVGAKASGVGRQVKDFITLRKTVDNFRSATSSASGAVAKLAAHNLAFGKGAPGAFATARVASMSFMQSILSTSKAFKILKLTMMASGIGVIILGFAAAVMLVVKNFDKIRTQAKPGLDALKAAFEALKRIGMALVKPFLDFFATLGGGGSKKGKSTIDGIANAFNTVAKAVQKVAEFVEMLVNKYVVPLLYKFLGMIFNVIKGVVQFIKGIIKLKDNWREGLKMMWDGAKKIFGAIIGFFLSGVIRPMAIAAFEVIKFILKAFVMGAKGIVNLWRMQYKILITIFFGIAKGGIKIVDLIITAWSMLPRGIGNGIEKAANLFADFVDGIADSVRGTPIIGWLADKAGIIGAGRSAANAIRGIGSAVGTAGRGIADFVSGLMDPVYNLIGNAESAALDLVDSVADGINGFLDSIPEMADGLGDWVAGVLEGFGQGDDIGRGAGEELVDGAKKEVEEGAEEVFDPFIDAGGDAGDAAGSAAGENFLEKIAGIIKDLQQKFVDLVLDSVKGALDEATGQLEDALQKQKEAALAVYDEQLKTLEKLEKAEESLTREKEYQANRRRLIDERELQRANYQRNRALAIYEGRIDDARVLSLEDQKNQTDFQDKLTKTDEERRQDLVKENLDYLKESIKNAQEETQKMLDDQIKAFQDAAKEITKFPPLTIEEYTSQLGQLNDAAQKIAGENGEILKTMMTKMKDNLKMPNANVGVFSTGLDELVRVAQQKYGLTGNPNTDTIVGATIGMLAGIEGQIVGNRESIVSAFDGIVTDVFDVASSFGNIADQIISPALDEMSKIFADKNPMKVFEQAVKDANETILREMQRTVGHVASLVDGLAQQIDRALIELAIAQEKISGGLGGGAGAGGSGGSGGNGGNGGDSSTGDSTFAPPGGTPGSAYQQRIESVRKGIIKALIDSTKAYSGRSYYQEVISVVANGLLDVYTLDKYSFSQLKSFFGGADEKSTMIRNILGLKPWGGIVTDLNRRYAITGIYPGQVSSVNNPALIGGAAGGTITARYFGGRIPKFAYGGAVGAFSSQSVPAILHGGEYIVNAKAVKNIGYATLEALNNMRYATPGKMSGPAGTVINETQNVNIYVDTFIGQEQWFESMMKEYNVKVVPRNQKKAGLENRTISTYSGINRGM